MKVLIQSELLTDSPYTEENQNSFTYDEGLVDQLAEEIRNSKPSSYLVSGYRGVGKTSFINKLNETLSDQFIFVTVSVSKYQGYPNLVKKLIRQLYLTIGSSETANCSKESLMRLELLYDRTFNNITFLNKLGTVKENSRAFSFKTDLKKLVPIVLMLLSGLNLNLNFLSPTVISYSLFLGTIIWTVISSLDLNYNWFKKKIISDEIIRQSLYDDEIAEHLLLEILKTLQKEKVDVIIVLDELDKIATIDLTNTVLGDIKALLLSGHAQFFAVSGQGLYYQMVKSTSQDDAIITSLFSKSIHISFPKYSRLKRFCLDLIIDKDDNLEIVNHFFDDLILKSDRVPRKLSNLIRQNILWEDSKAYLHIDDTRPLELKFESDLLKVINKIADNDLPNYSLDDSNIDFNVAQLHLWLKQIKLRRHTEFSVDKIIGTVKYEPDMYPMLYVNQLNGLCELFFDTLIEENILESRLDQNENEYYYSWKTTRDEDDSNGGESGDVDPHEVITPPKTPLPTDSEFIKDFIEFESYVRGMYIVLNPDESWGETHLSIWHMIQRLCALGVVSKIWLEKSKLKHIIETRNKIMHGKMVSGQDLDTIQSAKFELSRYKAELIEKYSYYVTKNHLKEYTVTSETKSGFDFIAENKDTVIVFEIKYYQVGRPPNSRNIYFDMLDKFMNFKDSTSKECYFVLFYFQPNGEKYFDSYTKRFSEIVNSNIPEFADRFNLFYVSEFNADVGTGRLTTYLDQVINSLQKGGDKDSGSIENKTIKDLPFDQTTLDYYLNNDIILNNIEASLTANNAYQVEGVMDFERLLKILKYHKIETTHILKEILERHQIDLIYFITNMSRNGSKLRKGFTIFYLGYFLSAINAEKIEVLNFLNTFDRQSNNSELASKILISMK